MKKLKLLIITIISIVSIMACAKIDSSYSSDTRSINSKGEYAITFSNSSTKSIANPAITHEYTSFNVYAWKDGAATDMFPYLVENVNNEWKYDEGNQELQYFERNSTKYDFIGVITNGNVAPANGDVALNVTGVNAFENNNDETITDDELLWAHATVAKADYANIVSLPFNHANAKMYIGFVSDRDDTEIVDYTPTIPAVPETKDTTDTWINLKRSTNVDGSPSRTSVKSRETWGSYIDNYVIPQALIDEIKSYYSVDGSEPGNYDLHLGNSVWPSSTIKKLRVVKDIPTDYKLTVNIHNEGILVDVFDAIKYLKDNGYNITSRISGGKPAVFEYVILDAFVNGTGTNAPFTVIGLNYGSDFSIPDYTINIIPEKPEVNGYDGIRVFSVSKDAITNKNIRTAHTTQASAEVSSSCILTQTANSGDGADSNITFVKPSSIVEQVTDFTSITESTTVTWSPTVWYALPVANPDNGYVVKFSYTYNGKTYYDARVHIPFEHSDFVQGKYYRYVICIGNKTNGTEDVDEAIDEKDEVDTDNLPIRFTVVVQEYGKGEFKTYILGE